MYTNESSTMQTMNKTINQTLAWKAARMMVLTLLVGAVAYSCSDSTFEENTEGKGYEYYPLGVGHEWIYEVDSAVYINQGNDVRRSSSQVRELIVDTTQSANLQYIIQESTRATADDPWFVTDVYTAELSEDQAFRTESNRRFIKLVFPVRESRRWDGNIHFDDRVSIDIAGETLRVYEDWDYAMSIEDTTVSGQTYTDALRVSHVDRETAISKTESYEYYAKDIGLVYKKLVALENQNINDPAPWEEKAMGGYIIEKRLLSFSK